MLFPIFDARLYFVHFSQFTQIYGDIHGSKFHNQPLNCDQLSHYYKRCFENSSIKGRCCRVTLNTLPFIEKGKKQKKKKIHCSGN